MTKIFKSETRLAIAFDGLCEAMLALERGWTSELERSGLQRATGDVRHHLCAAIAFLDDAPVAADQRRDHAVFEVIDDGLRVLAREAYLSVIALGQDVQHAWEDGLAAPSALERATSAIEHVLDELGPYVSRAEAALRRVALDDEPLEDALDRADDAG